MDLMTVLKKAGFKGEGLRMAYAIAMAESAGNARAHNGNANTGDNSYGLFQINMLGAMGPERRRQYGLSSNESLFDPLTNAKVAFRMSHGGTNWGPWSTYGNGAYKNYYGSSGASVRNSGGGGGDSGGDHVPMTRSETAESYGYVESLFDAVPELKKKFDKAVKDGWSTERFQAAIRDTHWWKTHSQQERDYLTKTYGDPASAKQEYKQAYTHVRQLAAQMGMVETPSNMKHLKAWAYNAAARGWSDEQLRNDIGKYVFFGNDTWQGQGGEVQQKLHDYAYQMGVKMSGDWYAKNTRNVLRGLATEQDYMSEIRKQAKAQFPQWSKQLDAGQTVQDLASPYLQSMSQILELPGGSINLFDPTIRKAMSFKNPKTGEGAAKPLWQFENELRSDPRWRKTQNAQNSLMQIGHQVLADFGFKY